VTKLGGRGRGRGGGERERERERERIKTTLPIYFLICILLRTI
jgi:hypothetical protein